jgi:DNA gyrase subunit A
VAIKSVTDADDLMIINRSGITLRLKLSAIRVAGRATQGVKLIDLGKRGDVIASVCQVPHEEEEESGEAENASEPVAVPSEVTTASSTPELEVEEPEVETATPETGADNATDAPASSDFYASLFSDDAGDE